MKKHRVGSSDEVPTGPCVGRVMHPANGPNGIGLDVTVNPDGSAIEVLRKHGNESTPLRISFKGAKVDFAVPSIDGHALRLWFVGDKEAVIDMITGKKWIGKMPEFVISD